MISERSAAGMVKPGNSRTLRGERSGPASSHLNAKQHTTLVETQRALRNDALAECNMKRMVNLATQSQLLREAAEAFIPREVDAS